MKFFIDTADINEIKQAIEMGMIDGVTTNPTLISKTGRPFLEVAKEIVEKGKFLLKKNTGTEIKDTIRKYCESEILFFDPMSLEITGNSRIYEKGLEILLK